MMNMEQLKFTMSLKPIKCLKIHDICIVLKA